MSTVLIKKTKLEVVFIIVLAIILLVFIILTIVFGLKAKKVNCASGFDTNGQKVSICCKEPNTPTINIYQGAVCVKPSSSSSS